MRQSRYLPLAGAAALALSAAAGAQYGPPPPGSAQGTESGTYGSSIGFDVRGTAPVDRFGRPNDLLNPTDTGRKAIDPRDARPRGEDGERAPGDPRGGATGDARAPGVNMNPGLAPGMAGSPAQPGVSPNVNPGLSTGVNPGTGPAGGAAAAGSAPAGAPGSRAR